MACLHENLTDDPARTFEPAAVHAFALYLDKVIGWLSIMQSVSIAAAAERVAVARLDASAGFAFTPFEAASLVA